MKLGIKVGPDPFSIPNMEAVHPSFVEVYFRLDALEQYNNLFSYLTVNNIETGLHFWGVTKDNSAPSLAFEDATLRAQSIQLMKDTIDIAHEHGFAYVNIHPGFMQHVYYDQKTLATTTKNPLVTPFKQATGLVIESLTELQEYANKKNVLLTVETTPLRVQANNEMSENSRRMVKDVHEYSIVPLEPSQVPCAIANDFGHTASNCITDHAQAVWQLLLTTTHTFAAQTRLIHIGFIVPPYNGTDFHNHMDHPLFESPHAIPNHQQLIQLLKLFSNRPDVYALVEPHGEHTKNFFLAKKLLQEAGVLSM